MKIEEYCACAFLPPYHATERIRQDLVRHELRVGFIPRRDAPGDKQRGVFLRQQVAAGVERGRKHELIRIFLENGEEAESFLAFPWFCFLKMI